MKEISCIRVYADEKQIKSCKKEIKNAEDSIILLSKALSLAGNEIRLKILYLLFQQNRLCVCDLSDILFMNPPAISQHLRKLKDGGIIQNQRVAQTIYYSLNPQYKVLLQGFFEKIGKNQILESV
tara:strand:- start:2522 stop:2896 length:375 start_codon:yes stop_codon:yes gene_type:complete